ncbi:cation:proton antiporter [Aerococcus sanguinicola]|uniref:cation:proton antiporter n=1 Tax=Aerococcus TaxID=1375 RepID=UPI0008A35817|nr:MULTISPECIES: cation:proton antiporter [Aerococcus]MDK7050357.1 cation:proton antiporter [Aerococcus sanguinicola]OFT94827.1 hypothetical protein HMPREF3090_05150 [Aerococcus sp. HMSC23C02]
MPFIQFVLAIALVYAAGRLIQKVKLPAILGWLLCGMLVGPNMLNLFHEGITGHPAFQLLATLAQVIVGIMIGSNLIVSKIKKVGSSIFELAIWQMLGIFLTVTLAFGLIFAWLDVPFLIAIIFAVIAMATAPAPVLSVINEYKTDGPLSRATVSMTVMNTLLVNIIFYLFISVLQSQFSEASTSALVNLGLMMVVPILIGVGLGYLAGRFIENAEGSGLGRFLTSIVLTTAIMLAVDYWLYPTPMANYIILGAAFSAALVNVISDDQREALSDGFSPVQSAGLLLIILNLAAPLDPSLLVQAGIWSLAYIAFRLLGSFIGSNLGGKRIGADSTVQKYLAFTMMPHSGISLVFSSMAAQVIGLVASDLGASIQIIIPAAALINEIIAVLIAKKAYEWAGEIGQADDDDDYVNQDTSYATQSRDARYYNN